MGLAVAPLAVHGDCTSTVLHDTQSHHHPPKGTEMPPLGRRHFLPVDVVDFQPPVARPWSTICWLFHRGRGVRATLWQPGLYRPAASAAPAPQGGDRSVVGGRESVAASAGPAAGGHPVAAGAGPGGGANAGQPAPRTGCPAHRPHYCLGPVPSSSPGPHAILRPYSPPPLSYRGRQHPQWCRLDRRHRLQLPAARIPLEQGEPCPCCSRPPSPGRRGRVRTPQGVRWL
mmetsp:Transcript_153536/g.268467  ORF Transcript_153536/g.268467 Transcript_153536/m.268467 type:complete len:229 (-) Transcript_153536:1282-1968(-)